ncbi:hypothetical protein CVT24_006137, partial [Panaeolus cyanescens]
MIGLTGPNDTSGSHLHPADIKACEECISSVYDTSRSILQEITNIIPLPHASYQEIVTAIISEDLQWAIQRAVLHGIELGRDAQRNEDRTHLDGYRDALVLMRQERDEAMEVNSRHRDAVMSKEKELRVAKDRLVAMQMAFDDMQETMSGSLRPEYSEYPTAQTTASSSDSEESDSDFWAPDSDDDLDEYEVAQMLALMEEDFLLQREIWEAREQPAPREQEQDLNAVVSSPKPQSSPEFLQGSSTTIVPIQNTLPARTNAIVGIAEMQRLITLSQEPGQHDVVKIVHNALLTAERTPRLQRTPAQKYLLRKWRKPRCSRQGGNARPSTLPLRARPIDPELEAQVQACEHEIIVDASYFGIGYIHKGVGWVGWRFPSQAVIPLGPDKLIIMSWAEMVAVEAGLRAFVTHGHRSC